MSTTTSHAEPEPPFSGFSPHPMLSRKYKVLKIWKSTEDKCKHILIVQLRNPSKCNAINAQMWNEIGALFAALQYMEEDTRAIVLTGNMQAFTAGIDWSDGKLLPKSTSKMDPARQGLSFLPQIKDMQRCFTAIEKCPIPVICAMDGYCIGAGIDLCCCCDIRLCTASTIFSIKEVKIGLAADIGTLQRLPKIVGNDSLTRQYCYTGDNFTSTEALQMGLVSRVLPDNEALLRESLKLATKISNNSPVAVTGTKQSLVYSRDHSVQEGLDQVATHNALALMTKDIPLSVTAAQQKTAPTFQGMPAYSKL